MSNYVILRRGQIHFVGSARHQSRQDLQGKIKLQRGQFNAKLIFIMLITYLDTGIAQIY